MRRLVDRLRGEEAGFTVFELLVSSTVGVIVMFGAFLMIETATKTTKRVGDRTDAAQRGRIAMDQIVQRLRAQVCYPPATSGGLPVAPIIEATDDSVTFYADVGGETFAPQKRQLVYSNGDIVENVWKGTGTAPNITWPAQPTSQRNVATGLTKVSGVPVFRYYGWTSTDPVQPTVLLAPRPLSQANRDRAVKIDVNFVAVPIRGKAEDGAEFRASVVSRTADAADGTVDQAAISRCT